MGPFLPGPVRGVVEAWSGIRAVGICDGHGTRPPLDLNPNAIQDLSLGPCVARALPSCVNRLHWPKSGRRELYNQHPIPPDPSHPAGPMRSHMAPYGPYGPMGLGAHRTQGTSFPEQFQKILSLT